ncbi:MAG: DRTGG domain-containing protein [Clostridiales bacterium]|nr:DRTGG domain-containing protein [Clostridiales bacterium]
MTLADVCGILNAKVLVGKEYLDREVKSAFASDMMSDVLAFPKDYSILLTGLCNPQVIRTAEMLDIGCIIFVRGKQPTKDILDMARALGLVILETEQKMFFSCGMLYQAGLRGGSLDE